MLNKLKKEYAQRMEYEKKSALFELAAQVAHDVRSPLLVLEITTTSIMDEIPKILRKQLFSAIQSVRDIANNLLARYRTEDHEILLVQNKKHQNDGNQVRVFQVLPLLEEVLSQKREEWRAHPCECVFQDRTFGQPMWLNLAPNKMRQVLSNLLNNAYEALLGKRVITIMLFLSSDKKRVCIEITDSGIGIPEDKLSFVLSGYSLKHPGKGMGLMSAKKYLEAEGGCLSLSPQAQGLRVRIEVPLSSRPIFVAEKLAITRVTPVVVIDDDLSIHAFWQEFCKKLEVEAFYFATVQAAEHWIAQHAEKVNSAVFLVDYDIHGSEKTGLDFISERKLQRSAYLMTSYADELWLQNKVHDQRIRLIPKNLLVWYVKNFEFG